MMAISRVERVVLDLIHKAELQLVKLSEIWQTQ